jgi:hypothetical protein
LILAAANKPQYARIIDAAVEYGRKKGGSVDQQADAALDSLVRTLDTAPGVVINLLTLARRVRQGDPCHHSWSRFN